LTKAHTTVCLKPGTFIEVIDKRQGLKIACLEEIAFKKGWISKESLYATAQPMA
jgi:dTDP-glucose pyrophosphorylase